MSGENRKYSLIGLCALAVLLAGIWLSYGWFDDARLAAKAETEELESCRASADRIAAARGQKNVTGENPPQSINLRHLLAQAAAEAGVAEDCVEGIHPDPARRSSAGV